ncbi:hypothetical protein DFH09DRAFT_1322589 [Mycena vulgaris]|nr:hypothetical protein DFH09DRAFT_1322589 [Mycena vulgaris]
MALADKAAGKDVGMWFGPSAAASAVRWVSDLYFFSSLPPIHHPPPSLFDTIHALLTSSSLYSLCRLVPPPRSSSSSLGVPDSTWRPCRHRALIGVLSSFIPRTLTSAAVALSFQEGQDAHLPHLLRRPMLVDALPASGLAVSIARDGALYQTEVYVASHPPTALAALHHHPHSASAHGHLAWARRLLVSFSRIARQGAWETGDARGNPVYYDAIKMLYTFLQSVGIAGGRPSSSYYCVE